MSEQTKDGYDIEPGDRFEYKGTVYSASGPVAGEFNAYVPVLNETTGKESLIIVRHGDRVKMLEPALTSAPPVSPA